MRRDVVAMVLAGAVAVIGCAKQATEASPPPSPARAAVGAGAGRMGAQMPVMPDSIVEQNNRFAAAVTARIAGREDEPAEQVFKDIRVLQGVPAGRLVAMMNQGYARGLGVSCTHCHDPEAWDANVRRPKTKARGMIRMVRMINEGNKTIPEFEGDPPTISCIVCHKGSRRPQVPRRPGAGRGTGAQLP
jgi:hypothetical protein